MVGLFYTQTVNDLLTKSNVHTCNRNKNKDGSIHKKPAYTGYMDNKWGKCKARFPHPLFQETQIDKDTGYLSLKKKVPWLNMFTPVLTYIFCCNTDVTSLSSGTAIKAVILYVSDYIAKPPLKMHIIFEAIKSIFTRNMELVNESLPNREKTRRLMSEVVNSLSAKMEMGAVIISMYLLGNPDYYTNHRFVPFYWQSFATEARKFWHSDETTGYTAKFALVKIRGKIIGISPVFDYVCCGPELEQVNLHPGVPPYLTYSLT
jgi:hypothetical protein